MELVLVKFFYWFLVLLIFYIFLGYPFLLGILTTWSNTKAFSEDSGNLPSVTLFIPAFNEGLLLAKKLENSLNLEYPDDLLEIAVASDGSTDQTNEILMKYRKKGITTFLNKTNKGKNSVINQFVPLTKGEIIIFTDSNSMFETNAILNLVKPFSDPMTGCVGGKLIYSKGHSLTSKGEGFYFKYENIIRRYEGLCGNMVGANGAIYALRRSLFVEVPEHVPNDFFHPLSVLKRNYHSVFAENAVVKEKPTESRKEEFKRRVRIVVRSIGALVEINRAYGIFRGRGWFNILSHKVLRWLTFPFLMALFICNIFLSDKLLFLILLVPQILFYTLGLIGIPLDSKNIKNKIFYIPYYFLLINIAGVCGIFNYLRGRKVSKWEPASTTR